MKDLFPAFKEQLGYAKRRAYVEGILVELAKSNKLYLTDVMNHEEPITSLAGDVLLGHAFENETHQGGQSLPMELEEFRVKIRAIPHLVQVDTEERDGSTSTTWEEMTTPIVYRFGSKRAAEEGPRQGRAASKGEPPYEAVYVDTGKEEVLLPVNRAWWCLKDQGENCKRATSRRMQRLFWKCKEVRPRAPRKAAASA